MSFEEGPAPKESNNYWIIWAIPLVFVFICLCLLFTGSIETDFSKLNNQTTDYLPQNSNINCLDQNLVLISGQSYSFEIFENSCVKVQNTVYIKNLSGTPNITQIQSIKSTGDPLAWENQEYLIHASLHNISASTITITVTKK